VQMAERRFRHIATLSNTAACHRGDVLAALTAWPDDHLKDLHSGQARFVIFALHR
jgi:hypothetical protein